MVCGSYGYMVRVYAIRNNRQSHDMATVRLHGPLYDHY